MTTTKIKEHLGGLFVPIEGRDGVSFAMDYMKEKNADKHAIYEAVNKAMQESGLTFEFSYDIASRATMVLEGVEDWGDTDAIQEEVSNIVPVYSSELMKIYLTDWDIVDMVIAENGNIENTTQAAGMAWEASIADMADAIARNLGELSTGN